MDVINLKKQFGRRYRVTYEESYHAEHGPNARVEYPWLMIIPCKYGQLYPWDESTLAASVDGYPKVAGQFRRLKCCRVHQDGDFGELTVLFDIADFAKVARIMRPPLHPTEAGHLESPPVRTVSLRWIGLRKEATYGQDDHSHSRTRAEAGPRHPADPLDGCPAPRRRA